MALVLDVSAIIPLGMADEDRSYSEKVLHAIEKDGGFVPAMFLCNVLWSNHQRRQRITKQQAVDFLQEIMDLKIKTLSGLNPQILLQISCTQSITVYDASYLELAARLDFPIATLDQQLRDACGKEEVKIFG